MNIAVYCSSSNYIAEKYTTLAYMLGVWIAENGHTLVFGGATGGSMSAVSEGAFSKKGKITGVIPDAVVRMKRVSTLCTELIYSGSMSERKSNMKSLADIFIVLPGSYGTLDELFDVLATGIVGEHSKPTIIINQDGFYDDLFVLNSKMMAEGFIPGTHQNYSSQIVPDIEKCIEIIKNYTN